MNTDEHGLFYRKERRETQKPGREKFFEIFVFYAVKSLCPSSLNQFPHEQTERTENSVTSVTSC
jgi:hypothetical protein